MDRSKDIMVIDASQDNYFKLIKPKESVERMSKSLKDSDIESVLHVRYEVVDSRQHVKRLNIQCSSDGTHWNDFQLGYDDFKQKVSERIKKMLADGKTRCTIHLSWLKGFDIIPFLKGHMGSDFSKYDMAICSNEQESWRDKLWHIFRDLDDSFWNSDRVRIQCFMKQSGRDVSLCTYYSKSKSSELEASQPLSNYHSILLSALNTVLCDAEEELPLRMCVFTCWHPGANSFFVMREVDRQLATYGASLIRKNHAFYVSKNQQLQEHERQAIKEHCSETIDTLKTLNPVLYIVEARHKRFGGRAVVGCYHDKAAPECAIDWLQRKMPGLDDIEYSITSLCSSAISRDLLQYIDYTDESAVRQLL